MKQYYNNLAKTIYELYADNIGVCAECYDKAIELSNKHGNNLLEEEATNAYLRKFVDDNGNEVSDAEVLVFGPEHEGDKIRQHYPLLDSLLNKLFEEI